MDIVYRNLFWLIRRDVLNDNVADAEPMSAYKWRRLAEIGSCQGVSVDVRGRANATFPYLSQDDVAASDGSTDELSVVYSQNLKKKLNDLHLNTLLSSRRLRRIVKSELHAIDTSADTLVALKTIIDAMNMMLRDGIVLKGVLAIGVYLRSKGNNVDFEKLTLWLRQLGLYGMARLIAGMLVAFFGFEKDEIPFVKEPQASVPQAILRQLSVVSPSSKLIRRNVRLMAYAPAEVTGCIVRGLIKRLLEIEE